MHLARGEVSGAERAFERAVRADPGHYRALTALGQSLAARGRTDRATQVLWRSLQANGHFVPTLDSLSALYTARGDLANAAGLCFRWADLHPEASEPRDRFFATVG